CSTRLWRLWLFYRWCSLPFHCTLWSRCLNGACCAGGEITKRIEKRGLIMRNYLSHLFVGLVLVATTACTGSRPVAAPAEEAAVENAAAPASPLEHIDVGVGFIPNIQFAPLYVAQAKGFYAEEGLDVTMEYGFENDFVALTAQGERQFAVASGDQVILARAQGLPLVYVMKWYDRFPVAVMALAVTGIDSPEKLAGHSVGLPGLFGASYVAWQALAYATGLDAGSVDLQEIGFTQAEAVSQKQVEAAVIYIANEPIQL